MKIFSKTKFRSSSIIMMTILMILIGPDGSSADDPSPSAIWSELLQRIPFPFRMDLPPPNTTPIDGTYTKFETKETPPVPCRRCPDYAPEGGIWKLNFSKGIFRIFHTATGWKDIGSCKGENFPNSYRFYHWNFEHYRNLYVTCIKIIYSIECNETEEAQEKT